MTETQSANDLEQRIGEEIAVTDWCTLDQATINAFAECTGDHQWIHVDVERARNESPFGGPVAHGMLTLSMLATWTSGIPALSEGAASVVNYGFDKVRFLAPVPAGARVRGRIKLADATPKGGGLLLTTAHTVEIEGGDKPALLAEFLVLRVD